MWREGRMAWTPLDVERSLGESLEVYWGCDGIANAGGDAAVNRDGETGRQKRRATWSATRRRRRARRATISTNSEVGLDVIPGPYSADATVQS